jgi:outer membrane lipoprotein carrier protein
MLFQPIKTFWKNQVSAIPMKKEIHKYLMTQDTNLRQSNPQVSMQNIQRLPDSMQRGIWYLLVGAILILATPGIALSVSADEIIDHVQKNYEKHSDFKANFIQEITIKTLKKTEREEGIVYFKKPKRMLWNYLKPKAKKLIINPQQAWLFVPEDRVVYLQSADNIFKSRLIIKFLTGIGKIGEDFRISFSQPDSIDGDGNYLLTLVPKDNDIGVKKLFLTVDKDRFQIIKCRFSDDYGNITQIAFMDMEIDKKIPDNFFTFKPPTGVEVFKMP